MMAASSASGVRPPDGSMATLTVSFLSGMLMVCVVWLGSSVSVFVCVMVIVWFCGW